MLNKNNRGQLSDTMTWVVATLIIVVVLAVFIYASLLLAEAYKVISLVDVDLSGSEEKVDFVGEKNSLAFEKNNTNEIKIKRWLSENES